MNGMQTSLVEVDALMSAHPSSNVDILICPPATLIALMNERANSHALQVGGQDVHHKTAGAHTGEISAEMLKDAGATSVIVGHSERRKDQGEDDAAVMAKATALHDSNIMAVICVGETLTQREDGTTISVITDQLSHSLPKSCTAENTVLAYEPVWAIGTGKVPTTDQIAQVHAHIRAQLAAAFATGADMRIIYGGSVKGSNAAEIFAIKDVDGALVGGASLKATDFSQIITALENA